MSRPPFERAASHARNAGGEAVAALRAVAEALPQASARGALLPLLRALESVLARLEQADLGGLRAALHTALDAEIRRWEARSADDADARTVLRAFLALREGLWDLGLRPPAGPEATDLDLDPPPKRADPDPDPPPPPPPLESPEAEPPPRPAAGPARSRRVERVPVKG